MTLVSVYLVDTERLYETCEAIDKSKEKFSNNPSVSSGNSSVGAITSKINELGNEIKKDYETTSKILRNYTNKVKANENKLKSKAVSVLENNSVVKHIPVMVTDSKTGTSEKTKETFADEGQVKTTKKEETLKDIADEFFENQRKSGTFVTSPIQNNNTFASSVKSPNDISTTTTLLDPVRISNAAENTKKENEAAEKRRQEEIKKREEERTFLDRVGATAGTFVVSLGEGVATLVQDVGKTGATIVHGVVTAFDWTGSQIASIWNEDSMTGFDGRNELRWMGVGDMLSQNYVGSGFDKFYGNSGFGQDLKFDAYSFDTVRNIGTGVGYVGGAVITGGAIGAASGVAGGTTAASAINAGVYGVARFGGSTGDAINDGASMDEAALYGLATGTKDAIGMFIGNQINHFTPFGTGSPTKTIENSLLHVVCDTVDGAASAAIDPVLQSLYTPSEESLEARGYKLGVDSYKNLSLGEKYVENFNANGGWNNIIGTAVFSGAMSLLSEIPDMTKNIIGYNQGTALYDEIAKTRKSIQEAATEEEYDTLTDKLNDLYKKYNNLKDSSKYYFDLEKIKQEINVGNITPESLNFLLDSNNTKKIFDSLTNDEKLSLLDSISKSEQDKIFESLGKTGTNIFKRKNKEYFSNTSDSTTTDTSSKIKFQFFAEPSETDLPSTKEFIDNARELSSQGKITQEYVKSLTDDQYKAILLQVDENPKLVSDVIAMSHTAEQIQQVKNAIKSMNGDELATVMDVNEFGMGFITRNAINNLDESQVTETLIRKVATLDDNRFKDFIKENTNSTLFSNQEIFDRAIATATKERKHFIFGLSDEIQFKIISNKEYVDMITDLGDINKVMNVLSLKNKEVLLNNIDFNNVSIQEKMNILGHIIDSGLQKLFIDKSNLFDDIELSNISIQEKMNILGHIIDSSSQKLFIDKIALFNNLEWKSLDNYSKISYLKKIIDIDTRLEAIKQSEILDDLHNGWDISGLIGMFNEKDMARALAELPLTTEQLKIALKYVDTDVLLTQISDSTTYLDKILEDVKSGKTKISIKNLLQSSSSVDTKVQYYITLAKHDMVDYVDKLSVDDILENKNGTTLLAGLLDADKNLTINKILSNEVKSDPKVATILKLRGLDTGKTNISHGTEKYNSDYIKRFNSSLGIGPIHQKGEALLNELQELFLNDGKSDKEIVESLVNGYRRGLIVDYDNCVKELQNLVNVKKQNLDRFYYIKQANTGYFMPSTGSIYMDDAVADTSLHETGHALHEYLAQTSTPKNYMEVIERAKANPDFMKNVEEYYDYYRSLSDNAYLRAQEAADTYFKDYYTDEKIEEITKLLSKSREELKQEFGSLGMMDDEFDATIIDIITKNMYKPEEYIETQKRIFVSQMHDAIMRSEYGGVTAIGDYIDRITDGTFQSGKLLKEDGTPMIGVYGHGLSYYFATNHGFDEMVANFASMSKMPNSKENLQMLKGIIGEEMYDMISSYYYKNIVNYGG